MESNEAILLESLKTFYEDPQHLQQLTHILADSSCKVSLRSLEWLVTNHAKKNNVSYVVDGNLFNIYIDYKNQLRSFSKRLFDAFKRRHRIPFVDSNGNKLSTTVAQLNFIRWCIRYGILKYAEDHLDVIDAEIRKAPAQPKKKTSVVQGMSTHRVHVRVTFA